MSSIRYQEPSKSPIPRSRSDFNYVGLNSREKRWTTDFSHLLPPYSRDGYSRLNEPSATVTLQPRLRNPTRPTFELQGASQTNQVSRSQTMDSCTGHANKACHPIDTKTVGRSQTLESCISSGIVRDGKHGINCTIAIKRSPTLATSKPGLKTNPFDEIKTSMVRHSPSLDNYHHKSTISSSRKRISDPIIKTLYPHHMLEDNIGSTSVRYPLADYSSPESKRHLSAVRRSPTLDPKTLRYSPLLNQTIIRNPTTDLSRSPQVNSRSSFTHRDQVVRSQSMRSLPKSSPMKMKTSESDFACPIHGKLSSEEDDFRRLRNFSVTPKGLINWGDSFRSQSVPGLEPLSRGQWDTASTRSCPTPQPKPPQRYRVAIVGSEEVGKTSLIRQFQTSEYICAFDTSYDIHKDYAITVILNKEESELEFIEHRLSDEEGHVTDLPPAAAYVVVYSVTSKRSFERALDTLSAVRRRGRNSPAVLVGSKSDLVRVRAITTDEGQTAALEKDCAFIETSTAINHQVDELLVSILAEIRSRFSHGSSRSSFSRAKGLIKRFLKKACFHAKSSDNL